MAGIRKKDQKIMDRIIECVEDYYSDYNSSPSIQYIASELEISKSTVHRYLMEMHEKGLVEYSSKCIKTERIKKQDNRRVRVPIVGNISCGTPEFAEEDFEEYVSLPVSLFGEGDFFILRTHGESMIEKGIESGDLVVVRKQNFASAGDIVVALVDGETTLKYFYPEPEKKQIRLHPANKNMNDIIVKECNVQGVAEHIIKRI